MATLAIDRVLAEMNKTGSLQPSMDETPRPEPKLAPEEIANEPNILAIPPFPRYSTKPGRPTKTSNASRRPSARRHYIDGPVPAPGTPQDRFAAVLGRSNTHAVSKPGMGMGMGMDMAQPSPRNPPNLRMSAVDIPSISSSGGGYAQAQPANHTIQDLPAPAMCSQPTGPAVDTSTGDNVSSVGIGHGGRGPALPGLSSSATQWLTYECQRRHFNPVFKPRESLNKDGVVQYQCNVVLNDLVIRGRTQFDNLIDAKVHVAQKALKQVRHKWPMAGPTQGRRRVSPETASGTQVSDPIRRQEELRQQLMRRHHGRGAEAPQPWLMPASRIDMGDPTQARAFVEGFKMGQMSAQRAAAGYGPPHPQESGAKLRSRSRSPPTTTQKAGSYGRGDRRHRCRSPSRASSKAKGAVSSAPRYRDGSRHDPLFPSADGHRPSFTDAEDRHGRLREFDDGLKGQ